MLLTPSGFFYSTGLSSLSLVDFNRGGSSTLSIPGSVQKGDLLIHYNQTENQSAAAPTVPAGFTSILTRGPNSWVVQPNPEGYAFKSSVSYRIADGTEGSTNITGMPVSTFRTMYEHMILVYRGNRAVVSVDIVNWANNYSVSSSSNPTRTLNITVDHAPLLAMAFFVADNTITEGTITYSPTQTDFVSGSNNRMKYFGTVMMKPADVSNISLAYLQTGSGGGGSGGGTLDKLIMSGYLRVYGD